MPIPEKQPISKNIPEFLTGANLKINFSSNAFEILDILVESYKNNLSPYNEAILPQEYKPKSFFEGGDKYGSHEHAMYFWNVCSYMSGRMKSDTAFKRLTDVFNEQPELFDCRILAQTDPELISQILKNNGMGMQDKIAKNWVDNAQKLLNEYDGDPRNIFHGVTKYEDCVNRISNRNKQGFAGFREKMTSMILYYFIDENLIHDINFPMPVDFHAIRVALATEMMTVEPKNFYLWNNSVEDALRGFFQEYLNTRGAHPVDITNAVWLLSSNLCNKALNIATVVESVDKNNGRFDVRELDPSSQRYSDVWNRSCGKCVLQSYCRYYIPSAPYYTQSAILPIDKYK